MTVEEEKALSIVRKFLEAGFIAYFASGCERDRTLLQSPA